MKYYGIQDQEKASYNCVIVSYPLLKMKNILNQTNGFIYFLLYFGVILTLIIYVLYAQSILFNIISEGLILLSSLIPIFFNFFNYLKDN